MPLVTFTQVQHLLPAALRNPSNNVSGMFDDLEQRASIIVRDKTNITIPADAEDAPDWVVQPMAWIIAYLGKGYFSNPSKEFLDSLAADYKLALEMLDQHIQAPADIAENPKASKYGTFTGSGGWNG